MYFTEGVFHYCYLKIGSSLILYPNMLIRNDLKINSEKFGGFVIYIYSLHHINNQAYDPK